MKNYKLTLLIWLVCSFIWLYLGDLFIEYCEKLSGQSYEPIYQLFGTTFVYLLDGVVLGILVILIAKINVTKDLLILICLPCTLLGIYPLLNFLLSYMFSINFLWDWMINNAYFLRIGGMTLVMAVFNKA